MKMRFLIAMLLGMLFFSSCEVIDEVSLDDVEELSSTEEEEEGTPSEGS